MQAVYTRRRILVLVAGTALPAAVVWSWPRTSAYSSHNRPTAPTQPAASPSTDPAVGPSSSTTPTTEPTTPAAPDLTEPALDHDLFQGMTDPKVVILQQRLSELGFDPGPADGYFGEQTVRAVWAFERLVMGAENAIGVVTDAWWRTLHATEAIMPRRPRAGTHVEVYLPEQAAAVFRDGRAELVTHVSTGTGEAWCQEVTIDNDDGTQTVQGRCGISITPGGVYRFNRRIEGWRNAALGRLYNPVYFNYGIAIHGATSVPNRPASRGCVRLPMHIAEYFPSLVSNGDAVFVFDGVKEPEHYGAQPPVFDWRDPDWIDPNATTTTAPTTTVPPTTAPPATTVPSPTTVPPATTVPPETTTVPTTTMPTTLPIEPG